MISLNLVLTQSIMGFRNIRVIAQVDRDALVFQVPMFASSTAITMESARTAHAALGRLLEGTEVPQKSA